MDFKDYARIVPRDLKGNLAFRRELLIAAADSKNIQARLMEMSAESITFWVNTFCWTHNPRKVTYPKIPFVAYEFQEEGLEAISKAILDQRGVVIQKCRDQGATWICIFAFVHGFLFLPDTSYFMMSRVAHLVEKRGNKDALFSKIDFILKTLPSWMVPEGTIHRTDKHIENLRIGSTIDGEATVGDASVGGRKTAAFYDEFPLVPDADRVFYQSQALTGCRIFNGTPNGTNNMFYKITKMEHFVHLKFHWWLHPEKAKGMFIDSAGNRDSPWFVQARAELGHNKRAIASQILIDYNASAFQFFDPVEIERLIEVTPCVPAYHIGEMMNGDFEPSLTGKLNLWIHVSDGDRPEMDEYLIGCDVAQGTTAGAEATPSVASILRRRTGEKVGEYASAGVRPDKFAEVVRDIAVWFYDASIIWENLGPGLAFCDRLVEIGYRNLYIRKNEKLFTKKTTEAYGWYPQVELKDAMMSEYRRALTAGEFRNFSRVALEECLSIVFDDNGHVTHSLSLRKDDPSGAKGNHADRVIADALVWKYAKEFGEVDARESEDVVEENSFLWRRQEREKLARQKTYWTTRRPAYA